MRSLPTYVGPAAFGIRMGVFLPGSDLTGAIVERMKQCAEDGLIEDGDVLCVTESVVARVQNNFVTSDDVGNEMRDKLGLSAQASVGVLWPLVSRNRFAPILEAVGKAAAGGQVIIQLAYPTDEVGNPTLDADYVESLKLTEDYIPLERLNGRRFAHPITQVDYVSYYREIVENTGARAVIYFSNDPERMAACEPDGILIADIHHREQTKAIVLQKTAHCITLQELCTSGTSWSEWGLLGSNLSSDSRLKLAPRDGYKMVCDLQAAVKEAVGLNLEVLIFGDGAYKDPTSGIYELADPCTTFAATDGLMDRLRTGVKYKFIADALHSQGKTAAEIEESIRTKSQAAAAQGMESEGTTPRHLTDILASLADLVSGSADAGTPLVLIKGLAKQT